MDLEGKLTAFEPIAVFQMLNLAQATGVLKLQSTHNAARIFFDNGHLTYAAISNRPLKLGEYLVNQGLISRGDLKSALEKKRSGEKLGVVLVENGFVEEAELKKAVKDQIKEVVFEVVRWREGRFEFTAGRQPEAQDVFIDIPLDHLMLEGLKRMGEEGT